MQNRKIPHDFTKTALNLACILPDIPKKNSRPLVVRLYLFPCLTQAGVGSKFHCMSAVRRPWPPLGLQKSYNRFDFTEIEPCQILRRILRCQIGQIKKCKQRLHRVLLFSSRNDLQQKRFQLGLILQKAATE